MLDPKSVAAHKPLTLRRNFSWTLVGNVVFAACQWGMLVILTRLSSPEVVGQFALGLAITAPVIFFFNLTLRTVQATDTKPEYMFGEYLGLRLITTTLALVTIVGIVLTAGYRWETALIILALGLAKATEAISDVIYGLLQQHERMDRIAVSMTIRGVSSLVAFGAGVYLTGSILWGLLGLITAWLLALLGYDVRSAVLVRHTSLYSRFSAGVVNWKSTLRPCWKPKTLAKLAWITLPLGLAYSIGSLNVNVPRYFIEYYLSERDLGFFAAMAYLLVAGNLIINALGQSATPRLARYYTNREDTAFYTLLLKLIGFAVLLGTIGVVIAFVGGQQILMYLYGPEYAKYPRVLVWITVAAGVSYSYVFLGTAINAMRRFKIKLLIHVLGLATLVLVSLVLIREYGLSGAAWAMLFAGVVEALAYVVVLLGVVMGWGERLPERPPRSENDPPLN